MGYNSTIEIGVSIAKEKLEEFRDNLDKIKSKSVQEDWEQELSDMSVDGEGSIRLDEYYGKWYHDREWCVWLAPYVIEGRVEFTGDDGEKWGYEFDGMGSVFDLVYHAVRGRKIRGLDEV